MRICIIGSTPSLHPADCPEEHTFFKTFIWLPLGQLYAIIEGRDLPDINHCVYVFRPKVHREPCDKVGSLMVTERLAGIELRTFRSQLQRPNPLGHIQVQLLFLSYGGPKSYGLRSWAQNQNLLVESSLFLTFNSPNNQLQKEKFKPSTHYDHVLCIFNRNYE